MITLRREDQLGDSHKVTSNVRHVTLQHVEVVLMEETRATQLT